MFKEIFNWKKIINKNRDYRVKYPAGTNPPPSYFGITKRPDPPPAPPKK